MRSTRKKIVFISTISILVLIEIISLFLMYKSSHNNVLLEDVGITDKIPNGIAIMLQNRDKSGYTESKLRQWPRNTVLNYELSGCIDDNGNKLEDSFVYEDGRVNISLDRSSHCYLYFDLSQGTIENCDGDTNLGECLLANNDKLISLSDNLQAGLYRFQGDNNFVDNNYICFGTDDPHECKTNPEMYMYRIIGINEEQEVKIMKMHLDWSNDEPALSYGINANQTWKDSSLYQYLKNDFASQYDNLWKWKIADTEWNYGELLGENLNDYIVSDIYEFENGFTSKIKSKFGLIYLHDYLYAADVGGVMYTTLESVDYKDNWMFLNNNEPSWEENYSTYGAVDAKELIMTMYLSQDEDKVLTVDSGKISISDPGTKYAYRPVFYLNANELYQSGAGTIDDPIMLYRPFMADYLLDKKPSGLNTDTSYGGLYRFTGEYWDTVNNYICYGTINKEECLSNTEFYLYRIIGIDEETKALKLIKKRPLSGGQSGGWYDINTTKEIKWPDSNIYKSLNGHGFLENAEYLTSEWSDRILTRDWKYGNLYSDDYTANDLYNLEQRWSDSVNAKIAIIYPSDLYYSIENGGRNCSEWTCDRSWINSLNNRIDEKEYMGNGDWFIASHDSNQSWSGGGQLYLQYYDFVGDIRPMFYVKRVYEFGGTGTLTDPFLVTLEY